MAAYSIRELILENLRITVEGLSSITTVKRKKLGLEDLKNVSSKQFPYVAVVGHLPEPTPKVSGRRPAKTDKYVSTMLVEIVVYGMDNTTPDTTISDIMDDLWAGLLADESRGGHANGTLLKPEPEPNIFDPYFALRINCEVTYIHTRSSI